jgi:hypothetical protein
MHEIRSIGVLSAARIMGAIYFVFGEVIALFVALEALAHGHVIPAILVLVFFGAIQGLIGFVLVAVMCLLFNRIAERIGGIEVHVVPFGR